MSSTARAHRPPLIPSPDQLQEWAERLHRQRGESGAIRVVAANDGRQIAGFWVDDIGAEPIDITLVDPAHVDPGDLLVVIGSAGAEEMVSTCDPNDRHCFLHLALRREAHVLGVTASLTCIIAEHCHDVMVVDSEDPVLLAALHSGITRSVATRMQGLGRRITETGRGGGA